MLKSDNFFCVCSPGYFRSNSLKSIGNSKGCRPVGPAFCLIKTADIQIQLHRFVCRESSCEVMRINKNIVSQVQILSLFEFSYSFKSFIVVHWSVCLTAFYHKRCKLIGYANRQLFCQSVESPNKSNNSARL